MRPIIILLAFIFSACVSETENNAKHERMALNSGLIVTEEELSVLKSEVGLNYKSELFSAFSGNEESLIKIINLRLNGSVLWDGAASDAFSSNLMIIVKKIGDLKFCKVVKKNSEWDKSKLNKIIFPTGDDGKVIQMYVDMLPRTYRYLSDQNEIRSFPQMVDKEGFRLDRTDGTQAGYRGHYLSGRLSKRIQGMSLEQKANMLIYLLGKEGATEFDGEIAYEFTNDFFGSDFHEVAREARRLFQQDSIELGLSPNEFSRVKTWLEARKSYSRTPFGLRP